MPVRIRVDEGAATYYQRSRNRPVLEGGVYHVTQRAPGKETLFLEAADYQYFKHVLLRTREHFGVSILCYSFLPNHVHLLLRIQHINLSQAMKHLFESYAKFFNKKYERKGHVFCGPFRAMLCDTDRYLLAASVYIHLNAFRAGLCHSLDDYHWHSWHPYATAQKKDTLVSADFVLSAVHQDHEQGRKEYLRIIRRAQDRPSGIKEMDHGATGKELKRGVHMYVRLTNGLPVRLAGPNRFPCDTNAPKIRIKLGKKRLRQIARLVELEEEGMNGAVIQEKLGLSRSAYFRLKKTRKIADMDLIKHKTS